MAERRKNKGPTKRIGVKSNSNDKQDLFPTDSFRSTCKITSGLSVQVTITVITRTVLTYFIL